MTIWQAIKEAHKGKYATLDVMHYVGGGAYYNAGKDTGYQDYCKAIDILDRHKLLMWVLKKFHII